MANDALKSRLLTVKLANIILGDTQSPIPLEDMIELLSAAIRWGQYDEDSWQKRVQEQIDYEALVGESVILGIVTKPRSREEIITFMERQRAEDLKKTPNGKFVHVFYDDLEQGAYPLGRYATRETPVELARAESQKVPVHSKGLLSYRVYGLEGRIF